LAFFVGTLYKATVPLPISNIPRSQGRFYTSKVVFDLPLGSVADPTNYIRVGW
jgi:hypothetical protein